MIERKFPTELKELKYSIQKLAEKAGLDFFDVVFEVVDYKEMNEIAACGGYPIRYHHWRFAMEHERLSKGYAYGLQRIYEIVINNDPCYSYLLRSNLNVDQKLVMAHVYAHSDFFKNNTWFSTTNRKMIDEMANHATRIRKYQDKHGVDKVEEFIDTCLSLENLIDSHFGFIKRRDEREFDDSEELVVSKLRADKPYMNSFINPSEWIEEQRKRKELEKEEDRKKRIQLVKIEGYERDILGFLIKYAPLDDWQKDILGIIREEAYYFLPQRHTKIMNEGWASYWHSKILTEEALKDSEVIDYAEHHAGTMGVSPGRINPYKLGLELFLDIEDRWNKGKFGSDYERCESADVKRKWDRKLGIGREKIFEVRRLFSDIEFLDEFLTEEFCREHEMFTYTYDEKHNAYRIKDVDFESVKKQLLLNLTNLGEPIIILRDANHGNAGELLLAHEFDGVPLNLGKAKDTLKNLRRIWGKPVNLATVISQKDDDKKVLLRCEEDKVETKETVDLNKFDTDRT